LQQNQQLPYGDARPAADPLVVGNGPRHHLVFEAAEVAEIALPAQLAPEAVEVAGIAPWAPLGAAAVELAEIGLLAPLLAPAAVAGLAASEAAAEIVAAAEAETAELVRAVLTAEAMNPFVALLEALWNLPVASGGPQHGEAATVSSQHGVQMPPVEHHGAALATLHHRLAKPSARTFLEPLGTWTVLLFPVVELPLSWSLLLPLPLVVLSRAFEAPGPSVLQALVRLWNRLAVMVAVPLSHWMALMQVVAHPRFQQLLVVSAAAVRIPLSQWSHDSSIEQEHLLVGPPALRLQNRHVPRLNHRQQERLQLERSDPPCQRCHQKGIVVFQLLEACCWSHADYSDDSQGNRLEQLNDDLPFPTSRHEHGENLWQLPLAVATPLIQF
jgi:hypothetical protein